MAENIKIYKQKRELGIQNNKDIEFKYIEGIDLEYFRSFHNQTLNLGKHLTVISGRNGTLKSTIMGLLSHPFESEEKSVYGSDMKTQFKDIFRLSPTKDNAKYIYYLRAELESGDFLKERIWFYYQKSTKRFRIVPSGSEKGDGFFSLPSMYISLKRLYPLIETEKISDSSIEYSDEEKTIISDFFERVLLRNEFNDFKNYEAEFGEITKNPKGPGNSAVYDINTISSGEDNLGTIIDALISFVRIRNKNIDNGEANKLSGLLSIDEIEASLHPSAQVNLVEYLIRFARKYRVQIILNTHSLYLIQQLIIKKQQHLDNGNIKLNFISSSFEKKNNLIIIENPPYKVAYSELTLSRDSGEDNKIIKPRILCEDEMGKVLIRRILKGESKYFDISHKVDDSNVGTSKNLLKYLGKNFPKLLEDANAILIYDADVSNDEIKDIKYKNSFILPSISDDKFPIEKEIIFWVLCLDNGDNFFRDLKFSKEHFRQSFSEFGIKLSYNNEKHKTAPLSSYKNWVSQNKSDFKKMITQYVKRNSEIFEGFREELLNAADMIFESNSLPGIER